MKTQITPYSIPANRLYRWLAGVGAWAWAWAVAGLAGTYELEAGFAPRFEITGTINALAVQPDNRTVVGGAFTTINGVPRNGLARLNADGTLDSSFDPITNAFVLDLSPAAIVIQPDGKFLVGGRINIYVAGGMRSSLIRIEANGSLDPSFNAGNWSDGGLDGDVKAMARDGAGRWLVGGAFSFGGKHNHVARLGPDGAVDPTFAADVDGTVLALAMAPNGQVVIGGEFGQVNGVRQPGFARLNADGTRDSTFAVGSGANGAVRSLAVLTGGKILLGGSFTSIQDVGQDHVARLGADGRLDRTFKGNNQFWDVAAVLPETDGGVLAGGWRPGMIFGGSPTDHDAQLTSQSADGTVRYGRLFDGKPTDVLALARRPDGKVVCGGSFRSESRVGGTQFYHGLCLLGDSLVAAPFRAVVGRASTVAALFERADGKLMAAGSFNLVNGVDQCFVARLNLDGTTDASYRSPFRVSEPFYYWSAGLQADGRLIFGNTRTLADGSIDNTFTNLPYVTATAMAIQADGKILIAAQPTAALRGLLRVTADGKPDPTFNVGQGLSNALGPDGRLGMIHALELQPDGRILAGGSFGTFAGQPRSCLVRLNPDGSLDGSFVPPRLESFGCGSPPVVRALALEPDGKVIVGGYFSKVAGLDRSALIRLGVDGSLDADYSTALGNQGGTVCRLVRQPDGRMLVGGSFQVSAPGGSYYNSFVRLNPDGSRDAGFAPSFGSQGAIDPGVLDVGAGIYGILPLRSGSLVIAGAFAAVDGIPRQSMARFVPGLEPPRLLVRKSSASQVTLSWTNSPPSFRLESSPDLGSAAAWTPVTNTPASQGGWLSVTRPGTDARTFFRLRRQ